MNRLLSLLTAASLVLACELQGQTARTPVVLHPELGDTIDQRDRERYDLYRSYPDFVWAVVLVASDSSVVVMIASQSLEGMTFDTLRTTSSLESMRSAMAWRIAQGPGTEGSMPQRVEEQIPQAVRLYPVKGPRAVEGKLLAVVGETIAVGFADSGNGSRWIDDYGWIRIYSFGDLRMAVLPEAPSGGGGGEAILGFLGGAVVGGVVGAITAGPKETGFEGLFHPEAEIIGGALLGGLVGLGVGAIVSTSEPSDEELYPARFKKLGEYARYAGEEAKLVMTLYEEERP